MHVSRLPVHTCLGPLLWSALPRSGNTDKGCRHACLNLRQHRCTDPIVVMAPRSQPHNGSAGEGSARKDTTRSIHSERDRQIVTTTRDWSPWPCRSCLPLTNRAGASIGWCWCLVPGPCIDRLFCMGAVFAGCWPGLAICLYARGRNPA